MCIVGFLQLRLLRYKNKRENRNLIAKKWQQDDKKMVFARKNSFWFWFLVILNTKSWNKQQPTDVFIFCGQKKLESKLLTALKSNHWLQSAAPMTHKNRSWLQSMALTNLKVPVDYNLHLQRTSKAELFSNQYLHQAPKWLLIVINTSFLFLIK